MKAKRIHWTKTPQGKKYLKLKKKRALAAKEQLTNGEDLAASENLKVAIAYAAGYTKAWLEAYANRSGIPERLLAVRVGQSLRS